MSQFESALFLGDLRVRSHKPRNGVVVSDRDQDEIAIRNDEQNAQVSSNPAFIIPSERTNAQPAMQMRAAENFRQAAQRSIDGRLVDGGEAPKGALIRRAGKNHGRQGFSFPSFRSR
jgi:hypothetical protein